MNICAGFYQNFLKSYLEKYRIQFLMVVLISLFFVGCGKDVSVLKQGTMEELSEHSQTGDDSTRENQINSSEAGSSQANDSEAESSQAGNNPSDIAPSTPMIYVDLGGAVIHPGVYQLSEGSRVFHLIEEAGGFAENAYTKQLNQADMLQDGQKIYVYTIEEAEELLAQGISLTAASSANAVHNQPERKEDGKVNLNLAGKEDLMTLTGIGETRAEAILQYREKHGKFKSVDELMQVEGIKQKTYEKIKDCITVQ